MNSYLTKLEKANKQLETFPTTFNNGYEVDEYFANQEAEYYRHVDDFYFPRLKECRLHLNQDFYRVSDFSNGEIKVGEFHNPPSNCTRYGRCNYQFYPVFYLSTNPIGAFLEVIKEKLSVPKTYYLSKWTCDFTHVLNSTVFLQEQLRDNHPWKKVEQYYYEIASSRFSPVLDGTSVSEVLKFVSERFLEDVDYRLSSFLSHQLLYGVPNGSDYIIYPSLREKYGSVNFAFHPKLVQNRAFSLKQAWKFKIDEFEVQDSTIRAKWEIERCFISKDGFNLLQTDDFDLTFLKTYFQLT